MEIIFGSTDTLPARAGEAISKIFEQYTDRPILLLFSGGSALSIIEHIDASLVTKRVTLGVLDERCNVDPEESNIAQLEATNFYRRAVENGAGLIDTRGIEGEGIEEVAAWVETTLRAWCENINGVILVTQGIGEDGHTAGMLPDKPERFNELFVNTPRFVVGYRKEGATFPERITVTIPFLTSVVTSSIVYVVGEKKRRVLEEIIKGSEAPLAQQPAQVIRDMNDVMIFTDQDVENN